MINTHIFEVFNEKTGKQVEAGFNGCYNIGLNLKEAVSCVKSLNDHEHRNGRASIYAIRRLTNISKAFAQGHSSEPSVNRIETRLGCLESAQSLQRGLTQSATNEVLGRSTLKD